MLLISSDQESLRYRLYWKVFNDTLVTFGLFVAGYFLIYIDRIWQFKFAVLLMIFALLVELIFSLFPFDVTKVLSNITPIVFMLIVVCFWSFNDLSLISPFLILFTVYTAFNIFEEFFFLEDRPFTKSIIFLINYISRAIMFLLILIYYFYRIETLQVLIVNIGDEKFREVINIHFLFAIINFFTLGLSSIAIMTALFYRASKNYRIEKERKSNWLLKAKPQVKESIRLKHRSILTGKVTNIRELKSNNNISEFTKFLESYYQILDIVSEKYNGFRPETFVDEFFIFFNNLQEAAKASLEIRETLRNYLSGYNLTAQFAINNGNILEETYSEKDFFMYTTMSNSVNTATIIRKNAEPFEILIPKSVAKDLKGYRFNDIDPKRLKGIPEDVYITSLVDYNSRTSLSNSYSNNPSNSVSSGSNSSTFISAE